MNKVLTICVPTYGRAAILRNTLTELINQASPHQIEIVISDNSEDELSLDVYRDLVQIYPNIRYQRNATNVGLDRNFVNAAAMASTEFFWIFGDDDMPVPGAITKVLEEINANPDVEFFLINSIPVTADLKTQINDNLTGVYQDKIYTDCREFLREISWYTTYVGAFVVKRSLWTKVHHERYLDTAFVHVGIVYEGLAAAKSAAKFVASPLILYRTGNATWMRNFLNIQLRYWRAVIELLPDYYDNESKRTAVHRVVERFVDAKAILNLRADGLLNLPTFRSGIWPYCVYADKSHLATWKILGVSIAALAVPVTAMSWTKTKLKSLLKPKTD